MKTIEVEGVRVAMQQIGYGKKQEAVRACIDVLLGEDVTIEHNPEGAPVVRNFSITISHSRQLAAVAIDPTRNIGIDAEEWRDALHRVKPRFLTLEEKERTLKDSDLLRLWTIKEAVYKAALTPGLLFTAIQTASDLGEASTPDGRVYRLYSWNEEETVLTLAILK